MDGVEDDSELGWKESTKTDSEWIWMESTRKDSEWFGRSQGNWQKPGELGTDQGQEQRQEGPECWEAGA